jgi:hypothetical protein
VRAYYLAPSFVQNDGSRIGWNIPRNYGTPWPQVIAPELVPSTFPQSVLRFNEGILVPCRWGKSRGFVGCLTVHVGP